MRSICFVLSSGTFASHTFSLFVRHSKATLANSNIGKSNALRILAVNAIVKDMHLHDAKCHFTQQNFSVVQQHPHCSSAMQTTKHYVLENENRMFTKQNLSVV